MTEIALLFTRPRTDGFLGRILGDTSAIIRASTWADEISETRPGTGRLHFSHTPYRACDAYNRVRDCPRDECIVEAIRRFTEIA